MRKAWIFGLLTAVCLGAFVLTGCKQENSTVTNGEATSEVQSETVPTESPTVILTATPTMTPTPVPTESPTVTPTATPTVTPTPVPTELPTSTPVPTPANAEPQETDSGDWHYGTVKRGEPPKERHKWYILSRTCHPVCNGELEIPDGISPELEQEIIDFYQEWRKKEPVIQGYDILKKTKKGHLECSVHTVVINGICSLEFSKYYRCDDLDYYQTENCFESVYKTYDLNSEQEIELKDLFYEDTNYVSLLDFMILPGSNMDYSYYGKGIQENQPFCFDKPFTIEIGSDLIYLQWKEMIELTALPEYAKKEEANLDKVYVYAYCYWEHLGRHSATYDLTESDSCLGINGIPEKTEYIGVNLTEVPDAVRESIQDRSDELFGVTKEDVLELQKRIGSIPLKSEKSFEIYRQGRAYRVSAWRYITSDEADYNTLRTLAGEELFDRVYSSSFDIYVNRNGNFDTYQDWFQGYHFETISIENYRKEIEWDE